MTSNLTHNSITAGVPSTVTINGESYDVITLRNPNRSKRFFGDLGYFSTRSNGDLVGLPETTTARGLGFERACAQARSTKGRNSGAFVDRALYLDGRRVRGVWMSDMEQYRAFETLSDARDFASTVDGMIYDQGDGCYEVQFVGPGAQLCAVARMEPSDLMHLLVRSNG
jgi:hypothetical protein